MTVPCSKCTPPYLSPSSAINFTWSKFTNHSKPLLESSANQKQARDRRARDVAIPTCTSWQACGRGLPHALRLQISRCEWSISCFPTRFWQSTQDVNTLIARRRGRGQKLTYTSYFCVSVNLADEMTMSMFLTWVRER